jgi:predicted Zn-dependent protease
MIQLIAIALWLAAPANAHDLKQGRFDVSGFRPDVIQFVEEQAWAPDETRTQTPEELGLQAWVERFVQAPRNKAFFGDLTFKVWITERSDINASASANGHIQVNRGLLDLLSDQPQMIRAILAHELAHVSRAHTIRLLSDFVGDGPLPDQVRTCSSWDKCRMVFQFLMNRKNTRAFEREADEVALELLDNAGMDPALLPVALKFLEEARPVLGRPRPIWTESPGRAAVRIGINAVAKACSTHPETCDRVSDSMEEIRKHGYEHAWEEIPKPRAAVIEWLIGLARKPRP